MNLFKDRREKLCKNFIGEKSIVIIFNDTEKFINEDNPYKYRPSSNFFYYTGFEDEESAIIIKYNGINDLEYHMFLQLATEEEEKWIGKKNGTNEAKNIYNANFAHDIKDLLKNLEDMLADGSYKNIYFNLPHEKEDFLQKYCKIKNDTNLIDASEIIDKQRVKKDYEEIQIMRDCCKLSANVHKKIMEMVEPGMNENDIDALLTCLFSIGGCDRLAYQNIVASGNNSTILHYNKNKDVIKEGDIFLIDAGGEYNHYAADITRTFPVNGKFNKYQKNIYEIVLKTQKVCIDMVKPGTTLINIHEKSTELITEGLIELGLLNGSLEECLKNKSYQKFYMHGIGHWLGMNVHDCNSYSRENILEPGHILTIEPGIYISNDLQLDEKFENYKGIGVRIEDDILVTENGCENLSVNAPKEIKEIEDIVGTNKIKFII